MSGNSVFAVIRRSPYRGLFIGEGFQSFGLAAGTTGLVVQVASDTGNTALSVAVGVAPAVAAVAFSPVVAPVLTRFGFYRGLVGTYLVAVVTLVATVLLSTVTTTPAASAITLMFLLGAVNTLHTPAVFATLGWLVGESNLSKGIASTNLRLSIAWIIGPIVGTTLVSVADGRLLLLVVAITYVIALIPYIANRQLFRSEQERLLAAMKRDPHVADDVVEAGVEEYQEANNCPVTVAPAPGAWGFLKLLRNPVYALAMAVSATFFVVLGTFSSLAGPWLVIDVGVAMMATGVFFTVRSVASLPGAFLVEWATDRLGMSRTLLLFAALITAGSLVAAAGLYWLPLAYLGMALFGMFYYPASLGLTVRLIALVFGKSLRVQAQTLWSFGKGVASFIFVGVGLLANVVGSTAILVAAPLLGMGLMLLMRFGRAALWRQMVTPHDC